MVSSDSCKVLVAINDNHTADVLATAIWNMRFTAYRAASASSILLHLDAFPETAIIFISMDFAFEENSKVLNKIRDKGLKMPVILFSQYVTVETLRLAGLYGCNEIIQYPVDPSTFIAIINKYIPESQTYGVK